ncbi:extracellular solute-binding protein [Paenibacillus sp. IB182496]|uniref:Extracellular solute-binding protein n=1 Tax=Paenibacillus sabuli TaxID=2772509 RepID=A0A927BV46_9BACL|nr:extracellular solute-binding protein [Paenibacillus sabuli]MBD2846305.1 extracellular solute-binding protein [Paenibacillus sabuli]
MRQMQKRGAGALAAVLLATALAGCAGGNKATTGGDNEELQPPQAQAEQKTKVTLWTHQSNLKDKMTELITAYNDTNEDGVEIELNVVADKYNDVLSLAFSTKEGPDIFSITGPSSTQKAAENGWVQPLNDYMTDDFKARFRDGVWVENNNVIGDQIYTLPDQASTMRLMYNKALFEQAGLDPEQPPQTFEELREFAQRITEASGGAAAGLGLPMGDGYYTDVILMNGMGYNAIGVNRGFDHRQGRFDFEPYRPLLELTRQIEQDGSMLKGALLVSSDQGRAKFAEGEIGIIGGASWDPGIFASMDIGFDVGVAAFPTIDGEPRGKSTIQMGSGYAMSAFAEDKDKAWKAMEYLYSPAFMGEIMKTVGGISLLNEVAEDPAYQSDVPLLEHYQIVEADGVWPPFPPGLKLQGDTMQSVFMQVINGQKEIDAALSDLTKRYNEAFERGISEGAFRREDFTIADFDPLQLQ